MLHPLVILLLGIAAIVIMIAVFRLNAFIALIASAMLVSLLSPGAAVEKIPRVAEAFGSSAAAIGIVIAMAAVIGRYMIDSGAADRIVQTFLRVLGERRAASALLGSGFVLSIPVFFDTVFYLLLPLARSLARRTGGHYVLFLLVVAGGAVIGHTLIPPTPGPLLMAELLNIDLGMMFLIGPMIGLPTAVVTLFTAKAIDRRLNISMRPYQGETPLEPLADNRLPGLGWSMAPVLLPIVLISANSVAEAGATNIYVSLNLALMCVQARCVTSIVGNPSLALTLSALIAMGVLLRSRQMTFKQLSVVTESALKNGGTIILITAAGGAFGSMLRVSGLTQTICGFVGDETGQGVGMLVLCLGYGVAVVLKWAQGSGTVSMITTAGMFAGMGVSSEMLGCHPAYLAMAIGSGSATGSWLNDSGFWLFSRMGGLSEWETIQTWTTMLLVLGPTSFCFTLLFAWLLPFSS